MSGNPTIKARFDVGRHATIGNDGGDVVQEIVAAFNKGMKPNFQIEALDYKWSLSKDDWAKGGGGWGKPQLTEYEKGYIQALRPDVPGGGSRTVEKLIEIIDRLVATSVR